jgi:hypothetical protein
MSGVTWTLRKIVHGALVVSGAQGGTTVVTFQYNPVNLRRKLAPQMIGGDAQGRSSPMTYTGAPVETIDVDIEIDAADQIPHGSFGPDGIAPQLAAIETVLYPPSAQVKQNQALLDQGTLEIGPYVAPSVLFVWGEKRVVPVKIVSYSVTEDSFDSTLNPIRASISLSMQVLSYSDLPPGDPLYERFMTYQIAKEQLAEQGASAGSVEGALIAPDPPS